MTGRPADIAALAQLAEAVFAARQAGMARLRQHEARLRAQIDDLENRKRTAFAALEGDDMALRAGVDVLFHDWVNSRTEALQRELALTLADQARARARLAEAFGRSQAAGALRDDAQVRRARDILRRQERG